MIRIDDQVSMHARVGKPSNLLSMIFFEPVKPAPGRTNGEGCIQIDQNVWLANYLPHGLHIRMFLRDMTAAVTILFKP